MSARIEGMARLRRKLGLLNQEEERVVKREVKRAAVNVQTGTKRKMTERIYQQPERGGYRRTGRLRNSITHQERDRGLSAVVGTNLSYAPHVEFGTVKMEARPTLFPAFEEERPEFIRRLQAALDDAHRKVSR